MEESEQTFSPQRHRTGATVRCAVPTASSPGSGETGAAPAAIVAVIALVVLAAAAFLGWRQLSRLDATVERLTSEVDDLTRSLDEAEESVEEAEERAARAEERAGAAELHAQNARQEADSAVAEAVSAEEQAARAQLDAQQEEEAREAAEAARVAAEERSVEARDEADRAREEARIANNEAQALRRKREQELARLESALSKIAETRRTAMGLAMSLGGDRIEFDFDRAGLRPENRELLSRIAGVLLTAGEARIQVFGHTDDIGTAEYNQQLSERRAQAVRDYLVEAGIDPEIITTRGFGKSRPLVEGTDAASRQRNRRVEIGIIQTELDFEPVG